MQNKPSFIENVSNRVYNDFDDAYFRNIIKVDQRIYRKFLKRRFKSRYSFKSKFINIKTNEIKYYYKDDPKLANKSFWIEFKFSNFKIFEKQNPNLIFENLREFADYYNMKINKALSKIYRLRYNPKHKFIDNIYPIIIEF